MNVQILEWLNNYLKETISENLFILIENDCYLLYSTDGNAKKIKCKICYEYYTIGSSFELGKLDVKLHGYNSKISSMIPVPSVKNTIFSINDNDDNIGIDIFGVIYWVLNRLEESSNNDLDKHGRFKFKNLHSHKYNYFLRPIIDEITDMLSYKIFGSTVSSRRCSRILLSHDIDRPYLYYSKGIMKFIRTLIGDLLKRMSIKLFINTLKVYLQILIRGKNADPNFNLNKIVDHSNKFKLKSTFYLMVDSIHKQFDSLYDIHSQDFLDSINYILKSNHLIGLHPSYTSSLSFVQLEKEVLKFKKYAIHLGVNNIVLKSRMHYLKFRLPDTMAQLGILGVIEDSSMGFSDNIGFRCGTCRSYKMINYLTHNTLDISISPLLIMDNAVDKMLKEDNYFLIIKNLYQVIRNTYYVRGDLTILWHNDSYNNSNLINILEGIINTFQKLEKRNK